MMLLSALLGCLPQPDSGTAVGNPTILAMQLEQGDGVTFTSANTTVSSTALWSPELTLVVLEDTLVDLVNDSGTDVPRGEWTALVAKFPNGLTVSTDREVRIIPIEEFTLVGDFTTDHDLILRIGEPGWVDADTWAAADSEAIAEALLATTQLYSQPPPICGVEQPEVPVACASCQ